MNNSISAEDILGQHPEVGLGEMLVASDTHTVGGVPHRALLEVQEQRSAFIQLNRHLLIRHHCSPAAIERGKRRQAAIARLGFASEQAKVQLFPSNPTTRKGNLAEVLLAEYLVSSTASQLPVFRLRYNPNVDQSMKGDDVLLFDVDSEPARIIVGEAKFRKISTKAAIFEMVQGLARSQKGGLPVSLSFVIDRLFESGEDELAGKIDECVTLFMLEKLRIDYVGLLMSDSKTHERVHQHMTSELQRLAGISLCIDSPESFIEPSYAGLEEQALDTP